jgi:hypothetical protein
MASSLKYYAAYMLTTMGGSRTTRRVSSYVPQHIRRQHYNNNNVRTSLPFSSSSSSFLTTTTATTTSQPRISANAIRLYQSSTTTATASAPAAVAAIASKQAKQSKEQKKGGSPGSGSGLYSAKKTNKQKRTFNNSKKKQLLKRKENSKSKSKAAIEPIHYGPLGRTALTENKLSELLTSSSASTGTGTDTDTTVYGGGLSNMAVLIGTAGSAGTTTRTPKMSLMEAQDQLDFTTPQFRIEDYTQDGIPTMMQHGNNLHKVTAVTIIHDYILPKSLYNKMKIHSHIAVSDNADYNWIELISIGIASTKKRATQLASMDQIALWNESIGIDLTLAPKLWLPIIEQHREADDKDGVDSEESFEIRYEKAQTLLELLRCSKIKYEHEEVIAKKKTTHKNSKQKGKKRQKKENQSWIADAEIYFRGKSYFSTGDKASNKKDAEQYALVGLFEQNDDLQNEANIYTNIIKHSPSGKHVSSLQVSRLSNDTFRQLSNSMKSCGINDIDIANHEKRKQNHKLLKQQYEYDELKKQKRNQQRTNNHRTTSPSTQHSNNDDAEQQLATATATATATVDNMSQFLLEQEQTKIKYQKENFAIEYEKMETARAALPIHNIRNDLINKLKTSQVIVVSGGTGSGKSTQCPQYILEDALSKGEGSKTKILVTQPRRIAAISVSERVSQERYEKDAKGDNSSVGYAVRFKSKKPRNNGGSIEFVTTGILLRRLLNGNDSLLQDISHVMIDEVHERDINTDFLLIL